MQMCSVCYSVCVCVCVNFLLQLYVLLFKLTDAFVKNFSTFVGSKLLKAYCYCPVCASVITD